MHAIGFNPAANSSFKERDFKEQSMQSTSLNPARQVSVAWDAPAFPRDSPIFERKSGQSPSWSHCRQLCG